MAQPTPWVSGTSYQTYANNNPSSPFPPASLDSDFANLETTLNEVLANLLLIQRDDGELANGAVTLDSLDQAVYALMGDWVPRGAWVTLTNYAVGDMVTPTGGGVSYVCAVAHTSGATFAAGAALGYWQQINGLGATPAAPSNILFSATDRVLGRQAAGGGAGEEITCTSTGRAMIAAASAAAQRTLLGLSSADSPTFTGLTVTGALIQSTLLPVRSFMFVDSSGYFNATAATTNGQLLIGRTGLNPVAASLTGTTNQVVVTDGAGTITLSTPQSIAATSTPTFSGVNVTGLSLGSVVFVGASSALSQDNANFVWDDATNRLGIGTNAPSFALHVAATNCSALVETTDVTQNATLELREPGAGVGDPRILFTISGLNEWLIGVDNSDGDRFKISSSQSFAVGNIIQMTTGGGLEVHSGGLAIYQDSALMFGAATSPEVYLRGGGAETIEQRNATAAQIFRVYRTFTDISNYERAAIQTGATWVELAAETAGTGGNDLDVKLVPAGTGAARMVHPDGVTSNIKYATNHQTAVTGATVTCASLIPDGAFVLGVVTRITTTLGATGGTTGYQVGDGADADRWGAIAAITSGTTSSNAAATANFTGAFLAANNVVLTAVGGNFDGTGAIRVTVTYIDLTPPTS